VPSPTEEILVPEAGPEPILVRCAADDVCRYDALGVVTPVTLDDLPGTEFLAVMLSPRPIVEDEAFADDEDGSVYLCRHHLADRVERHLRDAARQAPMRVWA
jgi:hypothetical protein